MSVKKQLFINSVNMVEVGGRTNIPTALYYEKRGYDIGYDAYDNAESVDLINDNFKLELDGEANMTSDEIEIDTGFGPISGIRRSVEGSKLLAVICRGLTGELTRKSSLDELADALGQKGWSSICFDYRGRGNSSKAPNLPTLDSMMEDVTGVLSYIENKFGQKPDAVIARGFGSRLALACLKEDPTTPLIMWAPILWLQTSLEIRYRMHEFRRNGVMVFDDTTIGRDFLDSLRDPTNAELRSWIVGQRPHAIVHGIEDQVVPIRLVEEARDLIKWSGGNVELYTLSGQHPHPGADVKMQIDKVTEILGHLPHFS